MVCLMASSSSWYSAVAVIESLMNPARSTCGFAFQARSRRRSFPPIPPRQFLQFSYGNRARQISRRGGALGAGSSVRLHRGHLSGRWDADPEASFSRRLGKSAHERGTTGGNASCPELWALDNGDVAIIGTELTSAYIGRLPAGVSIDLGEGLVVIPRTIVSAKAGIPDA
jgi:hypothetical protein